MNMNPVRKSIILLDTSTTTVNAYVEIYDDGIVRAGYYKDTAKPYGSVEEALARFREAYSFSNNKSAWEIAHALERHLEQKDEGR